MFMIKICCYLMLFISLTEAFEWPTITYKSKINCNINETFNPSLLQCQTCLAPNSVPLTEGKINFL